MNRFALTALLALAGCASPPVSNTLTDKDWDRWNTIMRPVHVNVPDLDKSPVMTRTEIACSSKFHLEEDWLSSLRNLKDTEHDIAAYNKLKSYYIKTGRCHIFRKGTRVVADNDSIWHGLVQFRLKGSPNYYKTYMNAFQQAE